MKSPTNSAMKPCRVCPGYHYNDNGRFCCGASGNLSRPIKPTKAELRMLFARGVVVNVRSA